MVKRILFAIIFIGFLLIGHNSVSADWWERPDTRATPPVLPRDHGLLPTMTPAIPASQPTATPSPKIGGMPSVTPIPTTGSGNTSAGGSKDDPCAPGKSYVGPYCGWTPSVGGGGSGGGEQGGQPRVGGPEVLGLSYTSGNDLGLSDIILLTGVLCLLLYLRSKMTLVKRI